MSTTTYHRISRDEFETVLSAAAERGAPETVRIPGVREIVYDLPTGHENFTVRVFSTLDKRNGDASRDSGSDAIRVTVWSHDQDRPVDSASRTHRIPTWASNFTPKVAEMYESADRHAADADDSMTTARAAFNALPIGGDGDNVIAVTDAVKTKFGLKVALDSPYAAKDAIKSLDWDRTHRSWDPDRKSWLVDADAIEHVASHLAPDWRLVR